MSRRNVKIHKNYNWATRSTAVLIAKLIFVSF